LIFHDHHSVLHEEEMRSDDVRKLQERMKQFGLAIIRLVELLPRKKTADIICGQLVRSGTSPGANYRAACRARSRADFVAKLKIVEEELDETLYWLELLVEAGLITRQTADPHLIEGGELLSIVVASIRTARMNDE
jgi:four helix bundle protein